MGQVTKCFVKAGFRESDDTDTRWSIWKHSGNICTDSTEKPPKQSWRLHSCSEVSIYSLQFWIKCETEFLRTHTDKKEEKSERKSINTGKYNTSQAIQLISEVMQFAVNYNSPRLLKLLGYSFR